jgi:hypothetical protein
MALSNLPGHWEWRKRGEKWWRVQTALRIEDGPHAKPFCHRCKLRIVIDPYGGSSAWVHLSQRAQLDHEAEP